MEKFNINFKTVRNITLLVITLILFGWASREELESDLRYQEQLEEETYEMQYEAWKNSPEGQAEIAREDSIYEDEIGVTKY